MKRCSTACFLICLSLLSSLSQAQTLPPGMENGLEETVSRFQKAFPAVELYVIALQGEQIMLENSKQAELRPGLELSLFREGKAFTHPITGITLGRFEEALGNVRLVEIKEDHCLAQVIGLKPGAEVKQGDKARITTGKIKLALWQAVGHSQQAMGEETLSRQLFYKLEASGRFLVIPPGEFQFALDKLAPGTEQGLPLDKGAESLDKKQLQQLAKTLGIRGIVTVQVKQLGGAAWMESELLSTLSGTVIAKTSVRIQAPAPVQNPNIKGILKN